MSFSLFWQYILIRLMHYRRPRILRQSPAIRALAGETHLNADNFIVPLFVCEGKEQKTPIPGMPGYFCYSLDCLKNELRQLQALGLRTVLLFAKIPPHLKDNAGAEALNPDGLMQRAIKEIKNTAPEMTVMSDVALDPYSSFGHDGIVENERIVNDPSVAVLAEMSLSHAQAGADFVAPSDMMDGRVGAIRKAFESRRITCGIMSYTAKYASALYGPFRNALDSTPGFGDKKTYQMDYANSQEALKELLLDEQEGADLILVKPAAFYLDIIHRLARQTTLPVGAYQVSGEYSMIKYAAQAGLEDEQSLVKESLVAIKRAGARFIISYFAQDYIKSLK